jgi:hypothetical protein
MDMNKGRISPTGGLKGHGHALTDLFNVDTLMKVPSQSVQGQIAAANTLAALRTAIQSWIAEQ